LPISFNDTFNFYDREFSYTLSVPGYTIIDNPEQVIWRQIDSNR